MRFLLHPPRPLTTASSIKKKVAKMGESATKAALSVQNSLDTGHDVSSDARRRTWGQQCSPNCGCVVRFEALVENQRIVSASYTTKQVVTVNGHPVLTAKGRPMLQPCHCSTLHYLSNRIVKYITKQQNMQTLKNYLEFQHVRSSLSFRQTVLATHQLPTHHSHCFDVVEEAFTAMMKGYMPQPRPQQQQPVVFYRYHQQQQQQQQQSEGIMEAQHQRDDTRTFGQLFFWNDEYEDAALEDDRKRSLLSSTLNMFDMNLEQQAAAADEMEIIIKKRQHPRDWVSYVDELYQEQEERSA